MADSGVAPARIRRPTARCRRCAGIVTPRWACKRCGLDEHMAHCHPDQNGCPVDCVHDWSTWSHRHPHDGNGHDHQDTGIDPGEGIVTVYR